MVFKETLVLIEGIIDEYGSISLSVVTPPKVTHKIVSIKITNVTKLKPLPAGEYWSSGAGSYKISDLPCVG